MRPMQLVTTAVSRSTRTDACPDFRVRPQPRPAERSAGGEAHFQPHQRGRHADPRPVRRHPTRVSAPGVALLLKLAWVSRMKLTSAGLLSLVCRRRSSSPLRRSKSCNPVRWRRWPRPGWKGWPSGSLWDSRSRARPGQIGRRSPSRRASVTASRPTPRSSPTTPRGSSVGYTRIVAPGTTTWSAP